MVSFYNRFESKKDDYITIMFEDDPRLLDFYEKIKDFPSIEGNFIQYSNVRDFKPHPLAFLQNQCLCNGKKVNQEEYSRMDISRCKCGPVDMPVEPI